MLGVAVRHVASVRRSQQNEWCATLLGGGRRYNPSKRLPERRQRIDDGRGRQRRQYWKALIEVDTALKIPGQCLQHTKWTRLASGRKREREFGERHKVSDWKRDQRRCGVFWNAFEGREVHAKCFLHLSFQNTGFVERRSATLIVGARAQAEVARLSPNTLAYVGDSVLELFWRTHHTWPPLAPVPKSNNSLVTPPVCLASSWMRTARGFSEDQPIVQIVATRPSPSSEKTRENRAAKHTSSPNTLSPRERERPTRTNTRAQASPPTNSISICQRFSTKRALSGGRIVVVLLEQPRIRSRFQ